MLEIKRIRENHQELVQQLKKRGIQAGDTIDRLLELDADRRQTQAKLDDALAELNKISKSIGVLFREGKQEEAAALKDQTATIKAETKQLQEELESLSAQQYELIIVLPNTPHSLVKAGQTPEENEEIRRAGAIPTLHEKAVPHWDLAEKYGLIDFESGVKITGAGFPVYKGKGARLQRALVNYFLDHNINAGYEEFQPPHFVNEASGFGTGQLPDKEGQMYHITEDNLYAIPTAEVPLTNLFRQLILDEKDLPRKLTAYTPCFRREAGSYGKDVRGLNRLHQFDKVEIVCIEKPEHSYERLEEMVAHVEKLLVALKLPYRILRLCGGDMGFTAAMTYDFEVYSAAQDKWLEISSVSNFETFQANRLKLRYRDENKATQLCHTLNGSSLALPRVLAAILENFQDEKGIEIPEVLRKYTGFDRIS